MWRTCNIKWNVCDNIWRISWKTPKSSSEDSNEISTKESYEEVNSCFKSIYDDDDEVTTLYYKQMFDLSVQTSNKNKYLSVSKLC